MADPHDDGLPPVPTGIQRLLRLATVDAAFRQELIARRDAIAAPAGVELTPGERAVLRATPAAQLEAMIAGLPPPAEDRRSFLRATASSAVVLLGGAAFGVGCPAGVGGARPDIPPAAADGGAASGDPRPDHRDTVSGGGAAPDVPARPRHPEMQTTGGAAPDPPPPRPEHPETHTKGGAAPDRPLPRPDHNEMQSEGGAAPDEPPPRDGGVDGPRRPTRPPKTRGIRPDIPRKPE